jgi:hypothetical protein
MSDTAVVTQTAAVHTVKVDGRKLTASQIRQLDVESDPFMVQPLGRFNAFALRLRKRVTFAKLVDVVGRHNATGALVRSYVEAPGYPSTPYNDALWNLAEEWENLPLIVV